MLDFAILPIILDIEDVACCDWLPVYVPSQLQSNDEPTRIVYFKVVIGFPFMYLRSCNPTDLQSALQLLSL